MSSQNRLVVNSVRAHRFSTTINENLNLNGIRSSVAARSQASVHMVRPSIVFILEEVLTPDMLFLILAGVHVLTFRDPIPKVDDTLRECLVVARPPLP